MQTKFKVLGNTDEITTCDCCGKTGLKSTWAVELTETGEIVYYGSVCVTRNTGIKNPQSAANAYEREQIKAAQLKFRQSAEHRALEAKYALRSSMKMLPGLEAMKFVGAEVKAANAKATEIVAEFGLKCGIYSIM